MNKIRQEEGVGERILREDKTNVDVLSVTQLRQNCEQVENGLKEIRLKDQNLQVGIEIEKQRLLRGFQKMGLKEQSLDTIDKIKSTRIPKVQVASKPIYKNQTSNDRFISVNKTTYVETRWIQKVKQLQKIIQIFQHNQTIYKQEISALNTQIQYLRTIITQKETVIIQFRQKSHQSYLIQINNLKQQHKLEIIKIINQYSQKLRRYQGRQSFQFNSLKEHHRIEIINIINQYNQKIRRIQDKTAFQFNTFKQQHRIEIMNIINQYNQKIRRFQNRQSFEIKIKELQILIKEKQTFIIKLQNQMKNNIENNRKNFDKQLKDKIYKLQSEIHRINQVVQRKQREKNIELQRNHQITIKFQQQRQRSLARDQQINRLNIIIKQIRKEFQGKQIQIENYKKNVRKYQIQKDNLFKKYQFEKQHLQEINTNLIAQIEILKRKIFQVERESGNSGNNDQRIDVNQKKIVQLAKINVGLQEEVNRLRLEIISFKAIQRKLFQRQQQFQKIQNQYNLTIKNLKESLTIIQTEYYNYKKDVEINIYQNHNCQYKHKLYQSELTIKKLLQEKQSFENKEADYKSLLLRYQVLEKQNQKLIIKMKIASDTDQKYQTRQNSQIKRLSNQIKQLQIKYSNYDQINNQKNLMSIRILQLQRSIQNYQMEIQRLRKIDYKIQNQEINLIQEYKKRQYQLNCQIQNKNENILLLENQVNRLSQVQKKLIQTQKKVLDIQRQSNILIQTKLIQSQNKNISLQQQIMRQRKQLERLYPLQVRLTEVQKYLRQGTNEIVNKLQIRIQQSQLVINKLKIQNHQFRQSINKLQIYEFKCQQLERQIISIESKKKIDLQIRIKQIYQQSQMLTVEINRLSVYQAKYIQAQKLINKLKNQINYQNNNTKYIQLENTNSHLQSELIKLRVEIDRLRKIQLKLIQIQKSQKKSQVQQKYIEINNSKIMQNQRQISNLQSEIKRLKLQIQRLRGFQIKTRDLNQQIQNIKRINELETFKLKSQISRLSQFQIKVNQLNLEIISIRSQQSSNIDLRIIQAEKARKNIENQTNKLKLQVQRLMKVQWQSEGIRNNLNNAQRKVQQLEIKIINLQKQIQRLKVFESKLFQAQTYIFSLEGKSNQVQSNLQRAQAYILQLQSQIARIKIKLQKLPSLQLTITQLKSQVQRLTFQLKKQIPSNANQNQVIEKYQLSILDLKNEIFKLSSNEITIKELNNQIQRLNNEIVKLKNQLTINIQSKSQVQKLRQSYQVQLIRLKSQISRLSVFQTRVQQVSLQITNYQLQITRLTQFQYKVKELTLEISSIRTQNDSKITQIQSIKNHYQAQITKLKKQIQRLQTFQIKVIEMNKQMIYIKNTITTQFQQQIQGLKSEIQRLKLFESKLFQAQTYIFSLEGKSNQVQSNLQRGQAYILQLQSQIARIKIKLQKLPSLQLTITQLKSQVQRLTFQLKKQIPSNANQNQVIKKYQLSILDLKNEIFKLSSNEITIKELNNQIQRLNNEIVKLKNQLTINIQSKSQVQKLRQSYQVQLIRLKSQISRLSVFQTQVQQVSLQITNYQLQITRLTQFQYKVKELTLEISSIRTQNDSKITQIQSIKNHYQAQITKLKKQIQRLQTFQIKVIEMNKQMTYIKTIILTQFQQQIQGLKSEIQRLKLFESKLFQAQTYIFSLEGKSNQLQSNLQRAQGYIIQLQAQINRLKTQINPKQISDQNNSSSIQISRLNNIILVQQKQIDKLKIVQKKLLQAEAYIFTLQNNKPTNQSQEKLQKYIAQLEQKLAKLKLQNQRLAQFETSNNQLNYQIARLKQYYQTQFLKFKKEIQRLQMFQRKVIELNKKDQQSPTQSGQIKILQTQIQRLKVFESKLLQAQTYIFSLQGKSGEIYSNLQKAQAFIFELQSQISRLKVQIQRLLPYQLKIIELNNQISRLRSQYEVYNKQKIKYQSQISNLKSEISKISTLQLKIAELNKEILTIRSQSSSQSNQKIIQLQKEKKNLQDEIRKLKADLEKSINYQSENQKFRLDLLEAKKKIASLESQITILQKQINRLKILEVKLVGLEGDLKAANQKYSSLILNTQSSTNLQLVSLKSQLQSIKKSLQTLLMSFNIQNISFSSFNSQNLPDYISKLYKLLSQIKSKFEEREHLIISLQTQCIQLKRILSQNSQSSNDYLLKIKIEKLQSRIFQLSNSNEAYLRINNSLGAKLQASEMQRQFLFNQYQKLRSQLQKLQNIQLTVLNNPQFSQTLDVEVVRNRLNVIESVSGESLAAMKNHYSNMQKQIVNQLNDLRKIVNLIDSQQNGAQNSNKLNNKVLNKLILDVSQLQSQYKKFHSTLWNLLGATTNQIKQLGKTIAQKVTEEVKNNKDQGQQRVRQLNLTYQQLDVIKRKYHASQLTIQTMERQKQKFSEGLLRLKGEMQSMRKQIQSANSQYLVARNQCQGWRQQTINLRNKIQRYQQQSRQINSKQSQINQYIQALQITKKTHQQEKQAIQNQLKNVAIALQSAQSYIRDVDNQKLFLIQQLQKLEQINLQIYSQRSILESRLNQFNQKLGQTPNINQELIELQTKVKNLQRRIQQAECQRDSLRNTLHSAIQDNQKLLGQNSKIRSYITELQSKQQQNRNNILLNAEISIKLSEANYYIQNLQNQIKDLQVRDHQTQKTFEQLQNFKNKLKTTQNYMFTIQDQKTKLLKQLQQVTLINKSIEQQKKILNQKLVELQLKDKNNEDSIGALEVVTLFQKRLEDYQRLILQAQKDREQLKIRLNQALQKNKILKENYDMKANQLDNKLTASQSQLHQKLLKTQQYVYQLQSQQIQLASQKTLLQNQIKSLLSQKQNIESSKAQLIQNYNNLVKQKQQNINSFNSKSANNQQITKKSIILQKQIVNIKQSLKSKENQINDLNFKLMEAQSQIIILKNKLVQLDQLKTKLTESQSYILSIKNQKQQLQQAYNNLVGERNNQNSYIGQLKNQKEQIIRVNNQLIQKINVFELQSLKSKQVYKVKQQKQQLANENKRLMQQNEVFKRNNSNLAKKLQRFVQLESDSNEKNQQISKLISQINSLKQKCTQLTNQNNQCREVATRLQLLNRDILKQNQNLKISCQQISLIKTKQFQQNFQKLEENKKSLQQQNSKLLEHNKDLHKKLQQLASNIQQSLQKPIEIPIKFEQAMNTLTLSINSEQNIQVWDDLIKTHQNEDLPGLSIFYENLGKKMKRLLAQKFENFLTINYQKQQIDRLKRQLEKSINDNQEFIKKINDYQLKLSESELLSQRYQHVVNQLVESEKSKQVDSMLIHNLQKQLQLHKSQVEQYTQKIIEQSNQEKNVLFNENQQLSLKLNNAIQQLQELRNNNKFNEQTKQLNQFLYNCLLKIQVLQKNANSIQEQLKYTQKTLKGFIDLPGVQKEHQDINLQELAQSHKEEQAALKYIKEIIDSDKNYINQKAKLQHYLQLLQKNINKSKQASQRKYDINYQFDSKDDIHRQLKQLSEHVAIYHKQTNRRRQLCLSMVQLLLQGTDDLLRAYCQIANDIPQIRIKQPEMQNKMKQLLEILNTLSNQLYPNDSPFQNNYQYDRNNLGDRQIVSSNYIQILKVVERKDKQPNDEEFSNALNFLKQSLNENISQYNEQQFGFKIQKSNNIINQIEQRKLKFYKNPTRISEEINACIIRIVSAGNDYNLLLDAIEALFEAIYIIQQRFEYMIKRKDEEYREHTNKMNQIFNRSQSESSSQQFNPLPGQTYPKVEIHKPGGIQKSKK